MLDYNTLSYVEGRAMLKQALSAADFTNALQSVKDWGGKQLADAAATGAGQWFNENVWQNPVARHTLIGSAAGGLTGLGSSMFQAEDERSPLSRTLTGALLGGLGGAGMGLMNSRTTAAELAKQKADLYAPIDRANRARQAFARGEAAPAAEAPEAGAASKAEPTKAEMDAAEIHALTPAQQARLAFHVKDPKTNMPTNELDIPGGLWQTGADMTVAAPKQIMSDLAAGKSVNSRDVAQLAAQTGGTAAVLAGAGQTGTGRIARALYGPLHKRLDQGELKGIDGLLNKLVEQHNISKEQAAKLLLGKDVPEVARTAYTPVSHAQRELGRDISAVGGKIRGIGAGPQTAAVSTPMPQGTMADVRFGPPKGGPGGPGMLSAPASSTGVGRLPGGTTRAERPIAGAVGRKLEDWGERLARGRGGQMGRAAISAGANPHSVLTKIPGLAAAETEMLKKVPTSHGALAKTMRAGRLRRLGTGWLTATVPWLANRAIDQIYGEGSSIANAEQRKNYDDYMNTKLPQE